MPIENFTVTDVNFSVTENQNSSTWSSHKTEKGALKGYREACEDGQRDIQIFNKGKEVFVFNTYDNEIGYKGLLLSNDKFGLT